jgi:diguanylate cyclase (GGDEF)-like protein
MRIVLVEPSGAARSAVSELLKSAGHDVMAFADPRKALARIKADDRVDALVAAADLAPTSGIELCWEVRLIAGDHRPVYVMIMAADDDERTAIEALDVGADDVIYQPLNEQEFHAKLRAGERLVTTQRKLIGLATIDSLTGLLNRRAFFERAVGVCVGAAHTGPVAAVLLDIDHFKEVNDLYGHYTGDEALRTVAREVGKGQAIAGRLGGDEICILLDGHSQADAWEFAQRLRNRIAGLSVKTTSGKTSLTCSMGVAELGKAEDIDDLIGSADLALYRAKREGRDRAAAPPAPVWLEQNPRNIGSVARAARRNEAA